MNEEEFFKKRHSRISEHLDNFINNGMEYKKKFYNNCMNCNKVIKKKNGYCITCYRKIFYCCDYEV